MIRYRLAIVRTFKCTAITSIGADLYYCLTNYGGSTLTIALFIQGFACLLYAVIHHFFTLGPSALK